MIIYFIFIRIYLMGMCTHFVIFITIGSLFVTVSLWFTQKIRIRDFVHVIWRLWRWQVIWSTRVDCLSTRDNTLYWNTLRIVRKWDIFVNGTNNRPWSSRAYVKVLDLWTILSRCCDSKKKKNFPWSDHSSDSHVLGDIFEFGLSLCQLKRFRYFIF